MLFSRLNFSSELTSCGHWGKWNATFYFHAVLLMSFHGWNTDWAITWGMRCSVMFIRVKTSITEEGMIMFTRAPLCTSLRRVTAQTREPELIAAARVNACVGFISAHFWSVPEAALQGSDLSCHIKDCQNAIYYLNFLGKKINKKILYSFGTHAYRTERPLPKRFGMNTCTVTPLIDTKTVFPLKLTRKLDRTIIHNQELHATCALFLPTRYSIIDHNGTT